MRLILLITMFLLNGCNAIADVASVTLCDRPLSIWTHYLGANTTKGIIPIDGFKIDEVNYFSNEGPERRKAIVSPNGDICLTFNIVGSSIYSFTVSELKLNEIKITRGVTTTAQLGDVFPKVLNNKFNMLFFDLPLRGDVKARIVLDTNFIDSLKLIREEIAVMNISNIEEVIVSEIVVGKF
ncbi:hypothetical protein KO489_03465 [Reinekea forsetii]|nr:hypothetical protein [Reinekea forsetii]